MEVGAVRPKAAGGRAGDPFAPIAGFGFLSDCETTALVAPSGNIEWMCLPRMDSPSVFGSILDLSGYDDARPVRIGNEAYERAQHDVWGAIIGSIYLFVRKRDRLDDRLWKIIIKQVEDALANRRVPDRGMWEVRGEPRHFTSSKVFCWRPRC